MLVRLVWPAGLGLLLIAAVGCQGTIFPGDDPDGSARADAGPEGTLADCTPREAELEAQVGAFLESTCSHAGCHGPVGAQGPSLAAADLPELVEAGLFVPFNPSGGLMQRINPTDPTLIMPPTRHENPPETIAMLEEWIGLGAPVRCNPAPPRPTPAPNSLDQDDLFTCGAPVPFPRELALLTRDEFIHRAGGFLGDVQLQSTPFPATSQPFSTGTVGAALDPALVGLHLDVLEASRGMRASDRDSRLRPRGDGRTGVNAPNRLWQRSLSDAERASITCFTDASRAAAEVAADEACKRAYASLLLERYAFQRRPSDGEVDVLVGFLDDELAAEADGARRTTEDHLTDAAMMMFGTLHRPMMGGADGALSPDEWGHALAATLGTAPMNPALPLDVERPELGWVDDFRARRDAGELDSVDAARGFIAQVLDLDAGYVGGRHAATLETARPDLVYDDRVQAMRRPRRGRYWLAPRIAGFFREYFGYADVSSMAKDDPIVTSRWDVPWLPRFNDASFSGGYQLERDGANPNRPPHGEPPMVAQLDDFIARSVLEAEQGGGDVLEALLTGRTYRLPASLTNLEGFAGRGVRSSGACDPQACTGDGACCPSGTHCELTAFASDGAPVGECLPLSFRQFHFMAAVYGHGPIVESDAEVLAAGGDPAVVMDPAHAARWVEMPADERSGVLTHPTWLAMYGGNEDTGPSAVLRGHWVREHMFCEDVAGLDLVSLDAQLAPPADGQRARDRMVATFGDLSVPFRDRVAPDVRCSNAACHGRMNELGMTFEVFNHAGFARYDDHGQAPDGHAVIYDWPGRRGPVEVADALELTRLLAEDPHVRRCFLRHVFRYFAGRYETPADACVLAEMESAFAGGSFLAAVEALMTHDAWLTREVAQ